MSTEIIPTILIPGIQATALAESNSFDRKVLWRAFDNLGTSIWSSVFGIQLDAALQQDPRYDVDPASIVERDHISPMPYRSFVKGLAAKCPEWPIFLFGYDWRKSNAESADELVAFVEHVLGKLATKEKVKRVNVVTHSMGSYVLMAALPSIKDRIHKIAMCAPPLRGSPQAYKNMVLGPSSLLGSSDDVRKVARTYPSLYELLPWFPKALMHGVRELDLLVRDDWQSNVYEDIIPLVDARLTALKEFRKMLGPDVPPTLAAMADRCVIIAGVDNERTLTRLTAKTQHGTRNYVDFTENKNSMADGDGTVPLVSAAAYSKVVRTFKVQRRSFLQETGNALHFHGLFLQDSRVQNIVNRFLAAVEDDPEDTHLELAEARVLRTKQTIPWWHSRDGAVSLMD